LYDKLKEINGMNTNMADIKIFSGIGSTIFTKKICEHLNIDIGKSYTKIFSDGNLFIKILENVRGLNVFVVQSCSMNPNNDFMELLFFIDALKRASASSVTAIIPYFSYAKGDKKDEPRVSIRAKVCADCLESAGVDRILTMDLHSPQIQGFFKKPVDHLYGVQILCDYFLEKNINNLVVVSPDSGFAKNARIYAKKLSASIAIGDKTRTGHDEKAKIINIVGEVENKNALIVDDFTISCGTLSDIAKELKEKGAKEIYACVSHSVLNESGIELLNKSCIKELIITDTVEKKNKHEKIRTVSVSGLFAKAIENIHNGESLSELFE
jgi:ribose-phosphate pyrophosphokinase